MNRIYSIRYLGQYTLSVAVLTVVAASMALSGCNSVADGNTTDNGTLGSTIIADDTSITNGDTLLSTASTESADDYFIVSTEDATQPGLRLFEVVSKRTQVSNNLRFEWDFGTGELFTGTTHSRQFSDPGLYLVVVTAYDINDSPVFTLSLEVDIPAIGSPPTALAGPNQVVNGGEVVLLDGSNSGDPDNDAITYVWSQTGAAVAIQLNNVNGAVASFTAPLIDTDTTLQFVLTVSDGLSTVQDTVSITVLASAGGSPVKYIADAGSDMTVTADSLVTLDGSGSNASSQASYQWTQLLGPAVTLNTPGSAVASFTAPNISGASTTLEFALFVQDGGLSAFDNVVVTVLSQTPDTDPNTPVDNCPNDPNKTDPGVCGCGIADTDSDSDGTPDCNDACPNDVLKTQPGDCGCGVADTDTDADGTADCNDNCPSDPAKTSPGLCGCGLPDIDSNNDGVADTCTNASNSTTLNPVVDAQIRSGTFANTNYGNDAFMGVVGNGGDWNIEGYVRFDLSAITGVATDAQLRLYVENTGTSPVEVWTGADVDDGWSESTITWNNAPATNQLITTFSSINIGWVSIDISSQVQAEQQGNNTLTLNFTHRGSDYMALTTREGTNAPELIITQACDGVDSDGDGVENCNDSCPSDANKTTPGMCGCGVPDTDSDGDGVADCVDQCPGVADIDSDNDGVVDCLDVCPGFDDTIDSNGNGIPDGCEPPTLSLSSTSLNFSLTGSNRQFDVWNSGGGTLSYTLSDDASWLTVSPSSGDSTGERDTISAVVDRTGLADGAYQGQITVTPSAGTASIVTVMMTVGASGSGPNITMVPSRTTGVSPLAVFFDAVGTTSSTTTRPFHDLDYAWEFGDPGAGFTQRPGVDANLAKGPVAGHVFELPSGVSSRDYTVTLTVTDAAGGVSQMQQVITVNEWSGTTYYVANNAGSDSNSGLTTSAPFKTFGKAMSMLRTNVRILFLRGDTFDSTGGAINVNGPGIIGAYGNTANPKPIIRMVSNQSGFRINGADWRIMDLELAGIQGSNISYGVGNTAAPIKWLLCLRLNIHSFGSGIENTTWPRPITHDHDFFVDCDISRNGTTNGKGNNIFFGATRLAILGNRCVGVVRSGEHILRVWSTQRCVISHNLLLDPAKTGRLSLKLHRSPNAGTQPSQYIVISNNRFRGDQWTVSVGPQDPINNEPVLDVLIERNVIEPTPRTRTGFHISARDVTIRNNVADATGAGNFKLVSVFRWGIEPTPQRIHVYNNTAYRSDGGGNLVGCTITEGSGHEIFNMLVSAPNGSAAAVGTVVGTITGNNFSFDNPLFVSPSSLDFRLQSGSPAIDAGAALPTVFEDMLGVLRPVDGDGSQSAEYDVGAFEFVP